MKHPIDVVIGGILALMIAMGVGRFSYTPILPILQKDVGLSVVNAGYLASSNYIGYLLGAMMAGIIRWKGESLTFFRMILWIAIISIAGMGLTENYYLWVLLRFISGITSALIFVFTSSIVLDVLAGHQRMTWSGLFYSGVGFGIVLTGIVVPILDYYFGWRGTWIGLAAISALFSFTVVKLLKKKDSRTINNHNVKSYSENEQSKKLLPYLVAAYGFEGFGYIISGTFLVAIVEKIPAFHHFTSLSWILVGIAAIPSSYLWMKAVERYGYILALISAYFIQAISIVLPVFFYNSFGAFAGAFMFGVTFMGITTMATSAGRMIQPKKSTKVIGYLTSVYGIGQIIGPMVAGHLVAFTGNYRAALGLAAITLLIGAVLLFVGQRKMAYRFLKKEIDTMEIQFLDQTFGKEARNRLDQAAMESVEGARAALETFYYAFNNRDLDVFSEVWMKHPLIQLNNPVGGVMRGKDNIYQLYANIFQSPAKVWVEFHDIVEYIDGNIAVFAGREKGEFHVGNQTISLNIRTTRFFAYTDHQWYQIHHHGSIDDPNILLTYQNAIQKK